MPKVVRNVRRQLVTIGRSIAAVVWQPRDALRFGRAYRQLRIRLGATAAKAIVGSIGAPMGKARLAFDVTTVADLAETAASFAEDALGESQIRTLLGRAIMFRQIMAPPLTITDVT